MSEDNKDHTPKPRVGRGSYVTRTVKVPTFIGTSTLSVDTYMKWLETLRRNR